MKLIILIAVTLFCSALLAGPAAWYRWHSGESDFEICSQVSPGDGWYVVKGPFQDAVCKKLGVPH